MDLRQDGMQAYNLLYFGKTSCYSGLKRMHGGGIDLWRDHGTVRFPRWGVTEQNRARERWFL